LEDAQAIVAASGCTIEPIVSTTSDYDTIKQLGEGGHQTLSSIQEYAHYIRHRTDGMTTDTYEKWAEIQCKTGQLYDEGVTSLSLRSRAESVLVHLEVADDHWAIVKALTSGAMAHTGPAEARTQGSALADAMSTDERENLLRLSQEASVAIETARQYARRIDHILRHNAAYRTAHSSRRLRPFYPHKEVHNQDLE
jgi:hypothetical protein